MRWEGEEREKEESKILADLGRVPVGRQSAKLTATIQHYHVGKGRETRRRGRKTVADAAYWSLAEVRRAGETLSRKRAWR